ncbi:hypothetical protein GF318_02490 [Candidatus Micrarchaeota archaeon]|nr:hypothetical protein [Candidatus Micrarchaeota archaeon]
MAGINETAAGMNESAAIDISQQLTKTVAMAVDNTVSSTAEVLPGLLAAIGIFIVGWVVAVLVSKLFSRMLKAVRLESYLKEHKVEDAMGTVKISDVLVKILKYYIILVFLQASVHYIQLATIANFLTDVLIYAPALIGAFLVVLLSVLLGEYVKEMIKELSKSPLVHLTARITKLVIVYVGVVMALSTMGIDTELPSGVFMTIVQAAAFGLALAFAIAFGLGAQEDAKEITKKWRKHFKL